MPTAPAPPLVSPEPLPHALLHPVRHVRMRFQRWWQVRQPFRDTMTLTQRNTYILPTRPGFMLVATLLVLLIASINYQLNLGYLLTFLLAGSAVVGMHVCHATLRGITLSLTPPDAQFAGASAVVAIQLGSERNSWRHGIGLSLLQEQRHWSWTDVPPQGSATVHVAFKPERRGLHRVPTLTAETRFPLGTFRVWTVWRPAAQVLVYPAPEVLPPPLPPGEPRSGGAAGAPWESSGEYDGVRAYRRGDPLKLVMWKKLAKADELVSRDSQQSQQYELWLDLAQCGVTGSQQATLEARLSRLCAWVQLAEKQGLDYGLRLGGFEIKPGHGQLHEQRCLEALALC
jgi:uncharacterized protein (DUF58 family)